MQRMQLISLLVGVIALAGSIVTPTRARAQTFELEAAYEEYGAAFRAGVGLGDRLVLQMGAGFTSVRQSIDIAPGFGFAGSSYSAMALAVPLDLKVYLAAPSAGSVVPLARLEVRYERGDFEQSDSNGIYAALLVGAEYMITEVLGLVLEGGVDYGVAWVDPQTPALGGLGGTDGLGGLGGFPVTSQTETLRLRWRAGIVLRI